MGYIINPYIFGGISSSFGAVVKNASDATTQNYNVAAVVTFDTEVYDYGGWHSTASNTSRLVVPTGISYAKFGGCISASLVTANAAFTLQILKNGSALSPTCKYDDSTGGTSIFFEVLTPVISVAAADYFELQLTVADTSITVASDSHFWVEARG